MPMMSCLENGRRSHWTPKTSSPPATTWVMKGMLLYWSHDGRRRQGGCWSRQRNSGAPRALCGLVEGSHPHVRNADVAGALLRMSRGMISPIRLACNRYQQPPLSVSGFIWQRCLYFL